MSKVHVVAVSDTHLQHNFDIPEGDLLVVAGDITWVGSVLELSKVNDWFGKLKSKFQDIVFISGNHDRGFERDPAASKAIFTNATYIQDQQITVQGLKIYGSPWTPEFGSGWAFNLCRYDNSLEEKWSQIPENLDILMTHGPPHGVGDMTVGYNGFPKENAGCYDLMERVKKVKPKYHIFGHIHSGYGVYKNQPQCPETIFANVSVCNEEYSPVNAPTEFDLEVP